VASKTPGESSAAGTAAVGVGDSDVGIDVVGMNVFSSVLSLIS
jgi:hypothetical protein